MAATAKSKASAKPKKTAKRKYKSKLLLSNTRKPADMSVNEWQSALRGQIAERSAMSNGEKCFCIVCGID